VSIDVHRAVTAFIDDVDTPNGSMTLYGKLSTGSQISKTAIYAVQTILADSFCVSFIISFLSCCPDHVGMEGLAMLYRLEEIFAYNRLARPYGPRDDW
jgi:hypothetical protein